MTTTKTTPARRLRPLRDGARTSWTVLNFFADTEKTHAAFAERFGALPRDDRRCLAAFYRTWDIPALLRRVEAFWNVPPESKGVYR